MNRIAVYPGSFDPVTLGHINIIQRGAALFDRLIVAVAVNLEKQTLFPEEDRLRLLRKSVETLPNVEVDRLDGLLVDYVQRVKAGVVLRGVRAVSDFDYEFQMAAMNRRLARQVETVFLMADESAAFISSRLIKEVAAMGGDATPFVPSHVGPELAARVALKNGGRNR
ncbi:MAG: pantetheine-phosphate adenylyltransferase [Magnetococcales bacterium]|nr:pantetheine-phosphate adenylyltransferase [Magnetococcales bacterium]